MKIMNTISAQLGKLTTLLFLAAAPLCAQTNLYVVDTTTPHTNLISSTTVASVAGVMTNAPMFQVKSNNITLGDSWPSSFGKMGSNDVWLARRISAVETNPPVFTATNLPTGSAPTVTNLGVVGGIAYYRIGIPAATPNTNTITAYNFTNQVLSSRQIPVYTTNYAFWDVASHGSNFLGRFAGVVDWRLNGGDDAGNPPMPMPVKLMASFSGSNSWFELTNSFVTQSNISLSIVTNGPSQSGGHQVNGGYCTIYTLDHWELYKKDNVFDYQTLRRNTPPVDGADLVTKSYVDTAIAFAINSAFNLGTDSQGISHYKYSVMGSEVVDLVGVVKSVQITGCVSDGLGNVVLSIPVTNLVAGWQLQTTTNIALGGPGFTTFTNYAAVTNTGVLNLTVAMTQPQLFFRGIRIYGVAMKIGSNLPVDHSTNSTFGMGAGLIVQSQIGGTNYIVFSTGTNTWGRVAVPTNGW